MPKPSHENNHFRNTPFPCISPCYKIPSPLRQPNHRKSQSRKKNSRGDGLVCFVLRPRVAAGFHPRWRPPGSRVQLHDRPRSPRPLPPLRGRQRRGAVGHVLHQPGKHGARRAAVPVPSAQPARRVPRRRQHDARAGDAAPLPPRRPVRHRRLQR
jgi:hypothetical protein